MQEALHSLRKDMTALYKESKVKMFELRSTIISSYALSKSKYKLIGQC